MLEPGHGHGQRRPDGRDRGLGQRTGPGPAPSPPTKWTSPASPKSPCAARPRSAGPSASWRSRTSTGPRAANPCRQHRGDRPHRELLPAERIRGRSRCAFPLRQPAFATTRQARLSHRHGPTSWTPGPKRCRIWWRSRWLQRLKEVGPLVHHLQRPRSVTWPGNYWSLLRRKMARARSYPPPAQISTGPGKALAQALTQTPATLALLAGEANGKATVLFAALPT